MLSYRHGFHAGNTADVFKHSVLFSFLTLYTKKEKPFTAFDLNGGAGMYNLLSEWSLQTGEAENLKKLYKNIPNIHVHKRDYCEAFCALTPPPSHRGELIRGFALFDPSYEVVSDYENIVYAIEKTRSRWQAGIFIRAEGV